MRHFTLDDRGDAKKAKGHSVKPSVARKAGADLAIEENQEEVISPTTSELEDAEKDESADSSSSSGASALETDRSLESAHNDDHGDHMSELSHGSK